MRHTQQEAASPVRLSVVICTKDRPRELATCLESLARQRRLPDEVLIVESSATPTEDAVAAFRRAAPECAVQHIRSQPGLPLQRNVGIAAADGDVVVFFDDDVVLEADYLLELARVYEQDAAGAIGGVGGRQVPDPTPRESAAVRAFRRFFFLSTHGQGRVKASGRPEYLLSPTRETSVEFLSGCNMSYRREVFEAGLRFDERLRGYALGEDLQFSYRVSRRWRLVLTPRARLDHRHTGGGRPETAKFREMAVFNKYLFFREEVATRRLHWLAFFWAGLGDLLLRLRAPRRRAVGGLIQGYARVVGHLASPHDRGGGAAARPPLAATPLPFVSVVVPARNEEGFLGRCLDTILAQDHPRERTEVLVVENGSTDRTAEVALAYAARDPRLRVIRSEATNQAAAMNDGIMAAKGDVVARVDAHSYVPSDYLTAVVAALDRHADAAGVGGPFLPAGETLLERVTGMARASRLGVGGGYGVDRERADHAVRTVQCGAYWRQALLGVGLFDVAMAYGEDEELNWRLTQAGGRVYLCGALAQYYRPRASLRALARQYWNYGQGRLRVLVKHPAFFSPRHLVPSAFVLGIILLTCLALVVPAARPVLAGLAAAYGTVLVLAGVQAARAGWREALLVPLAIACVHFGYGVGMLWGAAGRMARNLGFAKRPEEKREWQYVMERPRR